MHACGGMPVWRALYHLPLKWYHMVAAAGRRCWRGCLVGVTCHDVHRAVKKQSKPKKESILNLEKHMDKRVHVKFQGGREGARCWCSGEYGGELVAPSRHCCHAFMVNVSKNGAALCRCAAVLPLPTVCACGKTSG